MISFTEIEARPDMESDKKLDKLESFLGRLNSKGMLYFKLLQSYFYKQPLESASQYQYSPLKNFLNHNSHSFGGWLLSVQRSFIIFIIILFLSW